jgi:hypothetical protein
VQNEKLEPIDIELGRVFDADITSTFRREVTKVIDATASTAIRIAGQVESTCAFNTSHIQTEFG